ncbi:NAD(P)H-hydrate dehydratase [Rubellimicrobium roseum]|uniref:Bifunctional NAD(P)H-hydrate repair enzyme n=1 Tax=Rubellimicrobium roseum TaxID=687525 RepID=A0A5C4NJ35_9RHOB|nr:NAD(P)H-hydrate dehydratase [Rubellimicrobium roseum]TNC73428.1 NAD(P)H-hydrate dehydratase [Rubellimicrobium roseum]
MAAILTAAEMRALEQDAIARGEVTGLELMERAGHGVVEAILAEWPDIEQGARKAVVLCGPGNNGGDGFVVARLLKKRGWAVEVFLFGDATKLPPDAKANHDRWAAMAPVHRAERTGASAIPMEATAYPVGSLVVDALFGIGLTRPLIGFDEIGRWTRMCSPDAVDAASDLRAGPAARVVAIDVPSGLEADSGRFLAPLDAPGGHENMRAHLTVTFHSAKPGHYLAEGAHACGSLRIVDIGLASSRSGTRLSVIDGPRTGLVPLAKGAGHKYNHGHALILSGRPGRGGAARLAARGALRIGAGLVTLAVPPGALQENAARLDAIMLRSTRDAEALADLLYDARFNALAAGPGLGTSDREAALLGALLDASRPGEGTKGRAVVLDADALTLLSKDPDLRAKLHDRCVLTPHDGEFARLFPQIAERWHAPATTGPACSKIDAAREAAKKIGCTVLLKGPDTVIASPDGRAAINAAVYDRAAPWLATAGSGDVLAGFIAGLLARGFAPFDAACTAAWLHVECARHFGPGLIAEDLPDELPKVFRALGL